MRQNVTLFKLRKIYNVSSLQRSLSNRYVSKCGVHHSAIQIIAKRYVSTKDEKSSFATAYNSKAVESSWYSWWEKQGYFKPNTAATGDVFSMVLPPPNVTGTLHLGHALTCTIQDVLARWHRMRGSPVVWIPGMDHAGIATQVVVEKKLWQEQKLTRHDIGRDEFIQEVWRWKEEKGAIITQQLRRLGLSLDWSRQIFTMDEVQSKAVMEAFIQLFDAGLIYRANSLVNWSCILQSAISDIEVELKEVSGATKMEVPGYSEPVEFGVLTDFAYKLHNKDGEIVVSTTRVETMLGDTAVAVHPDDARYKNLHGSHVWHPFRKAPIPIICDEFVDPELGTGAVKVTPAHNSIDFEVSKRHGLEIISVINEKGELNSNFGKFSNLKRFHARKQLTEELTTMNLLRGKKDHSMQVPVCSRSGDVVELLLKPQWFVSCKNMAEKALSAVQTGELKIDPASFERTWYTWLSEIRDWCISRQLWWGHQIPAYECHSNSGSSIWVAARDEKDAIHQAAAKLSINITDIKSVVRDEDVLDTWFSSALFPFSALGWPKSTEKFYPLTLMETGHDILFFWVARMVMLGTQLTGHLPFKNILLHGIICDAQGRKMSKSLGNVILPDDIITGITLEDLHKQVYSNFEAGLLSKAEREKALDGQKKLFPKGVPECGADALRFTLCTMNVKNHFNSFDIQQCHSNSLFCNKIWQACRYARLCVDRIPNVLDLRMDEWQADVNKLDRWALSRLAHMTSEVNRGLHQADFHIAATSLRTFLYNELCDFYLETTKLTLKNPNSKAAIASCRTLLLILDTALHALSPFMPFLSEELYHHLPRPVGHHNCDSIMVAPYPLSEQWQHWKDLEVQEEIQTVIDTISAIRHLKSMCSTKEKPTVHITTDDRDLYKEHAMTIGSLSGCQNIVISSRDVDPSSPLVMAVGPTTVVHLIVKLVAQEDTEVNKREMKLKNELEKLNKIRTTSGYKNKAPQHVQKAHSQKIQAIENELRILQQNRQKLQETASEKS